MSTPVYISLGCDCSVSYQLNELGLRTSAMPFDWMSITNLDRLQRILENDFENFTNFEYYTFTEQSDKFNYEKNDTLTSNMVSLVKMVHNVYKFTLPHEHYNKLFNIDIFQSKYSRRIERFRNIVRDETQHKIFIRLSNTKEIKNIQKLEKSLLNYGCNNFQIKFINMDNYTDLIDQTIVFNWIRNYIPWKTLLLG
jgi:hypothetical protein